LRRSFLLVSFDRDGAYQKGLRVRWWDFLFYAVFGLVVTSFVRIAGVLLRLQLSHCARSLRNQSGDENQSPPAHWVGDRADWRNRWIISFLLVGFAFRCGDRLHVWCVANSHFTFRVVAASSSPFRRNAGFTITGRGASQFGQRRGFYGTIACDF